jgi:hypothetical protein
LAIDLHRGAQGEKPCLGPPAERLPRPFRPADRPHQNGVDRLRAFERRRRDGIAGRIDRGAAEGRLLDLQIERGGRIEMIDDAAAFGGDLRADAVAGKQQEGSSQGRRLPLGSSRAAAPPTHGRAASRAS